jgi:photosystem II stability/assembly factor-like uncharacterized protein
MRSSADYVRRTACMVTGLMMLVCGLALPAFTVGRDRADLSSTKKLSQVDKAAGSDALSRYGKLPLSFEENRGQADPRVKFTSRGNGYGLYLTEGGAVFALRNGLKSAAVEMELVGANAAPRISGVNETAGKTNYITGSDRRMWRTNVPNFQKVLYEGVYPGIDLVYYGNQRQLEYDFIVAAGGDPKSISLKFEGARQVRVDEGGDLVLVTEAGEIRQRRPFIYQEISGVKKEVAGHYVVGRGGRVSFDVAAYDISRPLVIDPVLVYSTFLGGGGAEAGNAVAVDSAGSAYVTGFTFADDFPTTAGAVQPDQIGNGPRVFVAKLNPAGTALIYSTYLGGTSFAGERGHDIAVDSSGSAYVTGQTFSADFPTTAGAFRPTAGPGPISPFSMVFVTKLDESGSSLVYSTFLGNGQGNAVAVDQAGNAYVAGGMAPNNFPVTAGAFQTAPADANDAFVTKLNPAGSQLIYSTLLGGRAGTDLAWAVAVDAAGNAFVAGTTVSNSFPVTAGAFQPVYRSGSAPGSGEEGFVTKLNEAGSRLVYSTYLGGVGYDEVFGVAIDSAGSAYVTGVTESSNFPSTPGALQQVLPGGLDDAFITKLNPAGSALVYSTFLGGDSVDAGHAIAVDAAGNATVTGLTNSINFPTARSLQETINGPLFKSTDGGGSWRVLNGGLRLSDIWALAIDSRNPSTLYAGNRDTVLKSTDGGQSWGGTGFGSQGGLAIEDIAVDPVNTDTVYVATFSRGVLKSTDGGTSWRELGQVDASGSLAIDPTNPSTVYVTSSGRNNTSGLSKSTNGGSNWAYVSILGGFRATRVVAIDPGSPSTLYVGTWRGDVAKSTDGGNTWRLTRVSRDVIVSITVDPTDSQVIYAGTDIGGAFQSTDAGATWRPILGPHVRVRELAVDPSDPATVYATTFDGLLKSTDRGNSWNASGLSDTPVTFVVIDPTSPATLYSGGFTSTDVFVAKLNATGSSFFYSTLLGGFGEDSGLGVALDLAGSAYVTGTTRSPNFPTANALQPSKRTLSDAFVVKLDPGGDLPAPAILSASISGKKLIVRGGNFSAGAVVLVNGQPQRTAADEQSPRNVLIAKKAGKKIGRGQSVTVQVRNSDGSTSEGLVFTRPGG